MQISDILSGDVAEGEPSSVTSFERISPPKKLSFVFLK